MEHKSLQYSFTQQSEAHCYEYFNMIRFTFLFENKKNLAAHQCTKKQTKTPDNFSPKIPIISPVLTFFISFLLILSFFSLLQISKNIIYFLAFLFCNAHEKY